MKHLLFIIIIMIAPLCMSAENYFTEGTTWEVVIHQPYPYDPSPIYQIYSIENPTTMGGYECLELKSMDMDDPSTKHTMYWLRTDGDKVYVLDDENSDKWELIYDFGLQPDESTVVRSTYFMSPKNWMHITCKGFTTDEDYGDFPCMVVDEYQTDDENMSTDTGTWFIGLGSSRGPLDNTYFEYVGGAGSRLLRATHNGETICSFRGYNGIESIKTDSSETETATATYYDMQGRPAQPDKPGIYIRKSPQATSKTIVR